jgi:hypothetical protein
MPNLRSGPLGAVLREAALIGLLNGSDQGVRLTTVCKALQKTHASTTDPDARLYRKGKGKETKLCFMGHGLMKTAMACWSTPV